MKKILAMLLALIMMLGLVACGGSTTTGGDTTTGDNILGDESLLEDDPAIDSEATGAIGSTDTEEEVLEPWNGDYENATFGDVRKYGIGSTNWDGSLPLSTTNERLEIGLKTSTQVTDYATNPLTVWLKEQTGVDLVIREFAGSSSDVNTQISLMLNGGEDMPDIITSDGSSNAIRAEYVEEGYYINLAGYYITDSYYFSRAIERACKDDPARYAVMMNNIFNYAANMRTGQVYGTVTVSDNPTDVIGTEAMINTKWLEKLGLQKPTTIDELYDVLVAFRDKDPNGNGKKDEIPMIGKTNLKGQGVENYLLNPFIQYTLERKVQVENGKVFSLWDTDEYRQALIFIKKLVDEGLLSPLTFTMGTAELQRLLNPKGDEPYTVGIACAYINGDYQEGSNSIFDYDPLPPLADCTGRGGYSFFEAPIVRSRYSICWDCENPVLAYRFLDFMYSDEAYLRQRWGEEGVDWDWIENTPHKDKAKGNGLYGGDARYVIYNQGFRVNSRWFAAFNTYQDELNFQVFVDPDATDYVNTFYKKSAQNVALQQQYPCPEEFLVFPRTPEEDEIFQETNAELTSLTRRAKNEFIMGMRDPSSDADWNSYIADLQSLNHDECWETLAQASYDRQVAEIEAIAAKMGK